MSNRPRSDIDARIALPPRRHRVARLPAAAALVVALAALLSCAPPWNNPYPAAELGENIFYSAFAARPKHLDPARSYSSNEVVFTGQIYEPPLQYHFLKRPYELIPLTATAVAGAAYYDAAGNRLADDGPATEVARSVYTIRIREGILFQPHPALALDEQGRHRYLNLTREEASGKRNLRDFPFQGTRELTAADYVYQIKRLADPMVNSPILGLMSNHIAGLGEYAERLAGPDRDPFTFHDLRDLDFEGAKVVDRYTYEIRLQGKYPQFVYWLAMPFFCPMAWEVDKFYSQPGLEEHNLNLDWFPVGTGPYMLTENDPNRVMILEKNPHFRGEPYPAEGEAEDHAAGLLADAGRTMPFIQKAVYALEKETIPYWNKFLQGYYDISGIASDSFDQAIRIGGEGEAQLTPAMREKGITLVTSVSASTFYTGFNMLDPVVGGYTEAAAKLRRALAMAIDQEEFISIFANGRGVAAHDPIPPGIFGHRDGPAGLNPYVYDWQDGKAVRKPLSRARQLLAEAGYPEGRDGRTGKPLVLYLDTMVAGPDGKTRLDWMRKQFAKLGLQLVVRSTDYNRFQEKMMTGNAQIFQWGWNADYPDPENFLFLLYGPNGKVAVNGENAANYANPRFDRLFEQMRNMDNTPARQAIIDEMLEIVRSDAPWIFGHHPKDFALYHGWLANEKPNLMANNTLKYRRLDPELRAVKRRQWNHPVLWPLAAATFLTVAVVTPAVLYYRRREKRSAFGPGMSP